jgi:hypothetical protein|tara:strand:+ start:113 stop:553 length:441 start_codon:yes stop_codon:yes gene_type:complete
MFWKLINPITIAIANSFLHRLISANVVVLYFKGVKTGKDYAIPVSYLENPAGSLSCVTDRPFIWWRNLINLEKLNVLYKGNMIEAEINTECEDNKLIADKLEALCAHSRVDGFFAEVGYKNGKPIREDVDKSAANLVLIQLKINKP